MQSHNTWKVEVKGKEPLTPAEIKAYVKMLKAIGWRG